MVRIRADCATLSLETFAKACPMTAENVTEIWDATAGKRRMVKDLRVVLYESGTVVQFVVVGKQREWDMFIPLAKFRETNPDVNVE